MERQLRNYKTILFPLLVVFGLFALTVVVGNFLLGRINLVRSETAASKQKNELLASRLSTLREVEEEITASATVASLAIPATNPSVLVTNLIRNLGIEHEVLISRFTINSIVQPGQPASDAEGDIIDTYEVNFEAGAGDYEALSGFVNALSATKPLLSLQSITIEKSPGGDRLLARIRLTSYSSPYPESLPALDQPLSALSETEQEVLARLESFTSPQLAGGETAPTEVPPRANPFELAQ